MNNIKGYEAFKIARENAGYSHREFAAAAGISLSVLVYYENGELSLLMIPVKKAIRIFELLNISLHDFYMTYYFDELNVTDAIHQWKENNPREYSVKKLYKRFYYRIFKYKERENISQKSFECILKRLKEVFKMPVMKKEYISDELYEKYIWSINREIEKCLEDNLTEEERNKNKVGLKINDYISHTDYSYKDLCAIIGIKSSRFSKCKNTENGFDEMQIKNALKICNVFSVRFEDVFITE